MGYAVACSSSHARVQEFLSGKLQVCKVLGGVSSIFQVAHLLISMETYITSGANLINEFTTCFCLKNIVRSSYVKNRDSSNY